MARLHPRSRHTFRIDGTPEDCARLVPLARDAVYVGYPYPLAKAHNAVALTAAHIAELRAHLEAELRRQGKGATLLADDFHAVLDRSVPG
jgi:hypothetical protein